MASGKSFACPVCGENVPAKAKACPHCGACEKSGWSGNEADGLDLPDEDFDYDKFVENEFGTPRKGGKSGWPFVWKITAFVLLVIFATLFIASLFTH